MHLGQCGMKNGGRVMYCRSEKRNGSGKAEPGRQPQSARGKLISGWNIGLHLLERLMGGRERQRPPPAPRRLRAFALFPPFDYGLPTALASGLPRPGKQSSSLARPGSTGCERRAASTRGRGESPRRGEGRGGIGAGGGRPSGLCPDVAVMTDRGLSRGTCPPEGLLPQVFGTRTVP